MYIDHCMMYTGWGVLCFFFAFGGGEFEFLSLSLPKPLFFCYFFL